MDKVLEPCNIGSMELRNSFVRLATYDNTADSTGAESDNSIY
ncbi:hypothetical protein ACFLVB_04530 [Chloroflexota bacterium]